MTMRVWGAVGLLVAGLWLAACSSSDTSEGEGDGRDTAGESADADAVSPEVDVAEPDVSDAAPEAEVDEDVAEPQPEIEDVAEPQPEIADVEPDIPVEPPPEPPVIEPGLHCSPAGQGIKTIYDLRDPACPAYVAEADLPTSQPGMPVSFTGVVVNANFTGSTKDTMFVQEEEGGPYSGLAIYKGAQTLGDIAVGDRVDVEGEITNYFGQVQLSLSAGGEVTKVGAGAAPEPFLISHPIHVATDGAVSQAFQGVLVRVEDVTVIDTRPDCPQEWGEFAVRGTPPVPNSLGLRVDDMGDWTYVAQVGDRLGSITGPLAFTWDNTKMVPRDDADLVVDEVGQGGQTKCVATGCLVAVMDIDTGALVPAPELGTLVISEILYNPVGEDTDKEWLEIANPGATPVSLAGWTLRDCGVAPERVIPLPDEILDAGDVFIIGRESNYADNGGVPVDLEIGDAFPLPNTVGTILLYDADQMLVDQVQYERFQPWLAEAGRALELKDWKLDNTLPDSWRLATKSYGDDENKGTPGTVPW